MKYDITSKNFGNSEELLLENSIEKLLKHSKNKSRFKKAPFFTSIGGVDISDYTSKSLRRSRFLEKTFHETKFINSAAVGSYFMNCNFNECELKNANFQECTFSESNFKNNTDMNPIINCNFNNSLFTDKCRLEKLDIQHSVFYETAFIQCTLRNIKFFSCTLQDTTFENVDMENIVFSDLNIDYSSFKNVRMSNVILPFSQICYAFGLIPYLMNTSDKIFITSASNENGIISVAEFLELLPDFEIYYDGTKEFLPLANIYLAKGENSKAEETILNGISIAITNFDFRQIKYLSKLIYTYSIFDFHQRKRIYDYIISHISFTEMNAGLLYKYNTYINQIKSFLLDNNRSGIATCEIDILTDVYPEESKKLGILLSSIEQLIEQNKSEKGEHNILCRHNSAEEILVTIQDIFPALEHIIPEIYAVFIGAFILDKKFSTRKKTALDLKYAQELKELEVKEKHIELEKKELELQEKHIEIERQKLQLQKEKDEYENSKNKQIQDKNYISMEILRKNITDHAICINEIHHITYGDIPPEADVKIVQYKQKCSIK